MKEESPAHVEVIKKPEENQNLPICVLICSFKKIIICQGKKEQQGNMACKAQQRHVM